MFGRITRDLLRHKDLTDGRTQAKDIVPMTNLLYKAVGGERGDHLTISYRLSHISRYHIAANK